jgi:phosphatidylglycerophosphate synthase
MSGTETAAAGASGVGATYKARDVEETLDVWFYRPLGYLLARAAHRAGLTPNAVTLLGMVLGIAGGHLLLYPGHLAAVSAIVLLIVSETFDSADGQLARLSGRYSSVGRILDGLASNLVFASIYLHLALRLAPEWGAAPMAAVVIVSAMSHSFQCAVADFYRNAFVHMTGGGRAELDDAAGVEAAYRGQSWRGAVVRKLLLRLYLNYTREQEMLTRGFRSLQREVARVYPAGTPAWVREAYREANAGLIPCHNVLTANTRLFALFTAALLGRPLLYFAFEIVVLNVLLGVVLRLQSMRHRRLAAQVAARASAPSAS